MKNKGGFFIYFFYLLLDQLIVDRDKLLDTKCPFLGLDFS